MSGSKVRVRFAPSPTGPLHIGGVRTALYNYLFAKKHGGDFLLRIEDTDQNRYVEGAEEYITKSLNWLGLLADESPAKGGKFGPYRQSERKDIYEKHVDQLISSGYAYYAFDTPEELDTWREAEKEKGNHSARYDSQSRVSMRNALTLSQAETQVALDNGSNVVVRLKVPDSGIVNFVDEVRGSVSFDCIELDDKILLKSDGLPTYHLANVVDDRLMKISHVIRGEEWLSSTAHHVLLYKAFSWHNEMPKFAHLPLILKPAGKGKLSKRDGAKFGFPVFPLSWFDEKEKSTYQGFKDIGFLPEALINFLAFMGWNPGNDEEIFNLDELITAFSLEKIVKSGAKFNFEKGLWYNHQYLADKDAEKILDCYPNVLPNVAAEYKIDLINLLKSRVNTVNDFDKEADKFMIDPVEFDQKILKKKYKGENKKYFILITKTIASIDDWDADKISQSIKAVITDNGLKFGDIMPILRVFMTGGMEGPDLFAMIGILGKVIVVNRMKRGLATVS